ncbi:MAG: hypothetical protein O9972_09240 [Burkholderiales bacterium]|nr:hypothetical protein [Burkholderiales bacterium]
MRTTPRVPAKAGRRHGFENIPASLGTLCRTPELQVPAEGRGGAPRKERRLRRGR